MRMSMYVVHERFFIDKSSDYDDKVGYSELEIPSFDKEPQFLVKFATWFIIVRHNLTEKTFPCPRMARIVARALIYTMMCFIGVEQLSEFSYCIRLDVIRIW